MVANFHKCRMSTHPAADQQKRFSMKSKFVLLIMPTVGWCETIMKSFRFGSFACARVRVARLYSGSVGHRRVAFSVSPFWQRDLSQFLSEDNVVSWIYQKWEQRKIKVKSKWIAMKFNMCQHENAKIQLKVGRRGSETVSNLNQHAISCFSKRNHCDISKWSNLYLHSTENRSKYKPTETNTMSIHIEIVGREVNARWNIDQNGIDQKQKRARI